MTDTDDVLMHSDGAILDIALVVGPSSERHVRRPEVLAEVREHIQKGMSPEDAVLATLHGLVTQDRRVADEFAAYFLFDLMKMGKLSMATTSRLRRFLDTGDLVLSVFGDLWGDLATLKFESKNQFKTLFSQRMSWKAADEARRLHGPRRREDRRVPQQPDELELRDAESGPVKDTIRREEKDRLILILLRLKDRDRRLLTLHLKGLSLSAIADEMSLTYEAARKALSRAIDQARRLAAA